jgi:diaminopimelate decarboxylase
MIEKILDGFEYRAGQLYVEGLAIDESLAARFGTPLYVYSAAAFRRHFRALQAAFAPIGAHLCYSVKSCSNLHILRLLGELGADFDVVSVGELRRVLAAGLPADRVVFAGVGKTDEELREALDAGIARFNVESVSELRRLDAIASARGQRARVALRLNPDVDPQTHRYITTGKVENKFGMSFEDGATLLRAWRAMPGIEMAGVHTHIGSQITRSEPYIESLQRTLSFIKTMRAETSLELRLLNLGGGFGIDYQNRANLHSDFFAAPICEALAGQDFEVSLEPGRSISANAGLFLTRVIAMKEGAARRFAIVDGAMNDLMRPCLYEAWHEIWPTQSSHDPRQLEPEQRGRPCDVVGPVCETGDFLALQRPLPELEEGQLLAVFSAGAYGMSMSSNYNSRPRSAEILIDGAELRLIRRRESHADLWAHEEL